MNIDEEDPKPNEGSEEEENSPAAANGPKDKEDAPSRLDAAKAFFRALNAGGGDEAPASAESKFYEEQIKQLEQKASEAETLYKRMAADFENYRKRVDREREELVSVGVRKAIEFLLPALDDLERALAHLNSDISSDKMIDSFKLVSGRIHSCLEQLGVKRMDTQGEPFDPRFHEPVQQIETNDQPDGTIVQELRGGYTLNDKVVRPALVNVASNPGETGEENQGEPVSEESNSDSEADQPVHVYDLGDGENA